MDHPSGMGIMRGEMKRAARVGAALFVGSVCGLREVVAEGGPEHVVDALGADAGSA
jgi:hypothetical protein